MRFSPEAHVSQVGAILHRFLALGEIVNWERCWSGIHERIRQAPLIEYRLREQYALQLRFEEVYRRRKSTQRWPRKIDDRALYDLYTTAFMTVSVNKRLSSQGQDRLRGMIRAALKDNRGFLSLGFELSVASDLMSKGFDVEFTDIEGHARYDYLVSRSGTRAEVECKATSYDRGRKVHRQDFYALAQVLSPRILAAVEEGRSIIISLELPSRLGTSRETLCALDALVKEALESPGDAHKSDSGSARVLPWAIDPLSVDARTIQDTAVKTCGHDFHSAYVADGDRKHAILFLVTSREEDRVLASIYEQLKKAAKDQLEGSHPGLLFSHIDEIEPAQWSSLRSRSGLQRTTERLLESPLRDHLHSVIYSSTGDLIRKGHGSTQEQGDTLVFKDPKHPETEDENLDLVALRPLPRVGSS